MTFNTALSAAQVNKLRGTGYSVRSWYADQEISICPNTTIFAARINGAIAAGSNYAQITYGTVTTGAFTDIQVGQTLLISHTNDKRAAYLRLRIRKAPTSTILYINEINNAILNNDYIFVIDHYDPLDRLARPNTSTNPIGQFKDYDEAFRKDGPVIIGLQTGYQGDSSSSTHNGLRLTFDVSGSYDPDGASITSYAWTFAVGTYTIVSGGLTGATLTIDITAGWQWGKLVVTNSNGVANTRRFVIAVDTYTEGFEGAQITGDLQSGFNAHVTGFAGLSTVLNGTFCIIGRPREYYNDVSGVNVGNSIDFVGWLNREDNQGQSDPLYSFSSDVSFELIGIAAALARLEMQQILMRIAAAPTVWDEIANLTPWRAVIHVLRWHTTLLDLCDLTFEDRTNAFTYPYFDTQGGNPLVACNQAIGSTINSSLEFAADGRIGFARTPWHLSQSARDGLTVIANFTNVDLLSIEEPVYHRPTIGRIDAYGGVYNSTSGQVTAFRSLAPGYAQGEAEGQGSLNNQVLTADSATAQAELNQRSGDELSVQNPNIDITFVMPDGYYWLTPSMGQVYTWTLDGSENVRGLIYTTSNLWVCIHVEHQHNNEHGGRETRATFRLIPAVADPGATVPAVTDGSLDLSLPELPPLDPFPNMPEFNFPEVGLTDAQITPDMLSFPGVAPVNGNAVLIWTASQGYDTTNYMLKTAPFWAGVAPSDLGSYQIKDMIFDPFYRYSRPDAIGAYLLASDGTNSKVWYTANIFAKPPVWTAGASFSGMYTEIKPSSVQGAVVVCAPSDSNSWSVTFDFTISDGGFIAASTPGSAPAVYVPGVGWQSTRGLWYPPDGTTYYGCGIHRDFASASLTNIEITYLVSGVWPSGGSVACGVATTGSIDEFFSNSSGGCLYVANTNTAAGSHTILWSGTNTATSFETFIGFGHTTSTSGASITITRIVMSGTGPSPFGSSTNNSLVRYSSDYGATFNTAVIVGTGSPGALAVMDIIQVGSVLMAAADKQVRISTSLSLPSFGNAPGGTLASSQPVLIKIPRRKWDNSDNINISAPDWLLGSAALVSGACLWKVTGAGVLTNITPTSCTGIVGPEAAAVWWQNSNRMAVLGTKSGATHLFLTTNGGTSWTDVGAFAGLLGVKLRAGPGSQNQVFAAGGALCKFSKTFVTAAARTPPVSSGILGLEVLG